MNTCNSTSNTVSVGCSTTSYFQRITNVADGTAAHDGVNVEQLTSALSSVTVNVSALDKQLSAGIAESGALDILTPSAPGKTTFRASWGNYNGENAFGGTIAHSFNFNTPIVVDAGVAVGTGSQTDVLARAGIGVEF